MSAGGPHVDATLEARRRVSAGVEPEIAALRRLDPWRRLAEIVCFSGLWIVGIALGLAGLADSGATATALRALGIVLSALALNAYFLLTHDGHHHLLFSASWANRTANLLLSVPLLHAPTAYRVLHDLHHRHLGGPGDPDEYRNYTSKARLRWTLQWVRLTIGTLVYMPLIPVVAWRRAGVRDRRAIEREYAAMGVVWGLVFWSVPMPVLLQVWLVPGVIVGYISAVRAVAQHALTPHGDPLLASRSVASNPVVAFFLLNENFHLEHHLFPEVPSYHLPRLRRLITAKLPHTVEARSYSRFLADFVRRALAGDESPLGVRRHVEDRRA